LLYLNWLGTYQHAAQVWRKVFDLRQKETECLIITGK
jgi:hypothetical protein